MEATPAHLARLERIEQEMGRDWDLRRAVEACREKTGQLHDPFFPQRAAVDWMSEITGEFEERVRAVRLVERLVELGLLRPYRMMANQLEFTELVGLLAERRRSAARAAPPPVGRKPRSPTPAWGEKHVRPAGSWIGRDGLTARAEQALLGLTVLADGTGVLPSLLHVRLYQVWQEQGMSFLPRDLRGVFAIIQHFRAKAILGQDHKFGPWYLTAKGRELAARIKARCSQEAAPDLKPPTEPNPPPR